MAKAKRNYVSGDRNGANKNIIMQLRSAQDLEGNCEVTFRRSIKSKVSINEINKVLSFYDQLEKPQDKRLFRILITQSPAKLSEYAGLIAE